MPLPVATSRTLPEVRAHEEAIAAEHPDSSAADALRTTAALIDAATQLFRQLPAAPLAELPRDAPLAQPVMVGDHLLAKAVRTLTPLGASALAHFGEMVSRSALAEADGPGDPSGVSRLLARIVAEARGVAPGPFVAAREREAFRLSRA